MRVALRHLLAALGSTFVSDDRHAFLLVGSPRRGKSTSAALGRYLGDHMVEHGW